MQERTVETVFRSILNLYRSGSIGDREVLEEARKILELSEPGKIREIQERMQERAVSELLEYLVSNADAFDRALGLLMKLPSGKHSCSDGYTPESLCFKVTDAIYIVNNWLYHLNLLLRILRKPEIFRLGTYHLPGLKITIIFKPSLRIIFEKEGWRKEIEVSEQGTFWCPPDTVCVVER